MIESYITFVAGIGASATRPDGAKQLIRFLTGPAAAAVIRKQGMETGF